MSVAFKHWTDTVMYQKMNSLGISILITKFVALIGILAISNYCEDFELTFRDQPLQTGTCKLWYS